MNIKAQFTIIPDSYAKKATERIDGCPVKSFPFEIIDIPAGAKYLALTLVDYDAIPVAGFSWIHWSVADIEVTDNFINIPEDFSRQTKLSQGKNSQISKFVGKTNPEVTQRYTGPQPPNEDHWYTLTAYALSKPTKLKDGFYLNELYHAIADKVVAKAQVNLLGEY